MDKIFERFGTYDIFSYLISGMALIAAGYIVGFPLFLTGCATGDTILVALFIVESYIYGMVVHEVASDLDRLVRIGYRPKEIFLSDETTLFYKHGKKFANWVKDHCKIGLAKAVVGKEKRKRYLDFAKKKLNKEKNAEITAQEQADLYDSCKAYLETAGKDGVSQSMDAMYALTRNLLVILVAMPFLYILSYFNNIVCKVLGFTGLFILLFFRADRFARYRVGEVMSHYWALKYDKAGNDTNTAETDKPEAVPETAE